MPPIKQEWYEITREVILEAQEQINASLMNPLHGELPAISVRDLAKDFFEKMQRLVEFATGISSISLSNQSAERLDPDLDIALVPLFKAFFLRARLAKARVFDQQRAKTTNPQVIAALEEKLSVYEGIVREEWFQVAVPEYPLSLSDMLTLARVEQLDVDTRFSGRQYDEKFHLLQAPSLFLPDLHYYRAKCGMRGIPVAIAFMDIDKFKDFNSSVGETHIDWHVLPVFMRTLEAHIYGHGHAYRFGGDEYVLLMPNTDDKLAMDFVQRLRERLATLRFHGTNKIVTVSVGLCVADRDCHLTDGELLQKSERAKNFAKKAGRDCVAGYSGRLFDEIELKILTPASQSSS